MRVCACAVRMYVQTLLVDVLSAVLGADPPKLVVSYMLPVDALEMTSLIRADFGTY